MTEWDRETQTELRKRLRDLPPIEWWVWQQNMDSGSSDSISERGFLVRSISLPWPYIRPVNRPGWGTLWPINVLRFEKPIEFLRAKAAEFGLAEQYQNLTDEHDRRDASIGSMLCISTELYGRGGPWRFLFTPPVYKFCDLDKSDIPLDEQIAPFDFWVQPEVFEATGEVLHGGPTARENIRGRGATPRALASLLQDPGRVYRDELEYVHVALDAFLSRGDNKADPEFVWSFVEERRRRYAARPDMIECPDCKGDGTVPSSTAHTTAGMQQFRAACRTCGATGRVRA